MATKKTAKKPIEVLFTDRVLMALACEIAALTETTTRIRAQMEALAAERGITIPN